MKAIHGFAGSCVESEVLKRHFDVYGFGIESTNFSKVNTTNFIVCDLTQSLPVEDTAGFSFGLFQPPCKRWSLAKNTSYKDYPNHIPRAKEIAEKYCDYWVIENVRGSPIGFDPDLRLKGDMFGLPIKFERCFWTNYDIPQPEIQRIIKYGRTINSLRKMEAKSIKGYSNDYHVHDIVMNSMPVPYVEYLLEYCPILSSQD